MSNIKVFAMQAVQSASQLAGWSAGLANTTHYIDPYDTHMDQNWSQTMWLLWLTSVIEQCKEPMITPVFLRTSHNCTMQVPVLEILQFCGDFINVHFHPEDIVVSPNSINDIVVQAIQLL